MLYRLFVTILLAIAPFAAAQSVANLLPAETMFALGTTGLDAHVNLLEDFIAEFEARGVGDALTAVFGDLEAETDMDADIPPALDGLDPLDVIGQDAWIAISASQFNPLPVVTLAARMSQAGHDAFAQLIADASADPDVEQFSEGGIAFWVMPLEASDAPIQGVAFAQADGVTVLSSNPDVLRGVLRRLSGSGEAGFTAGPGYAATLGQLGGGQFHGYLDLAALADVAAPFTQGMGFGPQIDRLQRALATAGTSGGGPCGRAVP